MDINFRTKFAKLLTSDAMREQYLNAFAKFIILNEDYVLDFLWKITYAPSSESFSVIELNDVSPEMYVPLKNELRYQYSKAHPLAHKIDLSDKCRNPFYLLYNLTDFVTASVIYEHCCAHAYLDVNRRERILFLLKDSSENNFFGGICAIGFSKEEAKYLKPYHEWIYHLFKAVIEEKNPGTVTNLNSLKSIENLVDEDTDEDIHEDAEPIKEDVAFFPEEEISITTSPTFKNLSPENILEDLEHFADLTIRNNMGTLLSIQNLGYDLNKVIAQKDEIATFIKAALIFKN